MWKTCSICLGPFCINYCLHAAWYGCYQSVDLLRCYGRPGCFSSSLAVLATTLCDTPFIHTYIGQNFLLMCFDSLWEQTTSFKVFFMEGVNYVFFPPQLSGQQSCPPLSRPKLERPFRGSGTLCRWFELISS